MRHLVIKIGAQPIDSYWVAAVYCRHETHKNDRQKHRLKINMTQKALPKTDTGSSTRRGNTAGIPTYKASHHERQQLTIKYLNKLSVEGKLSIYVHSVHPINFMPDETKFKLTESLPGGPTRPFTTDRLKSTRKDNEEALTSQLRQMLVNDSEQGLLESKEDKPEGGVNYTPTAVSPSALFGFIGRSEVIAAYKDERMINASGAIKPYADQMVYLAFFSALHEEGLAEDFLNELAALNDKDSKMLEDFIKFNE